MRVLPAVSTAWTDSTCGPSARPISSTAVPGEQVAQAALSSLHLTLEIRASASENVIEALRVTTCWPSVGPSVKASTGRVRSITVVRTALSATLPTSSVTLTR